MAEWRNGGMAELRNGGMAEWRDGRNRYLPTSFMVHADDDTDTFKSFIVQADRAFGSFTDRVSVGTVCFWYWQSLVHNFGIYCYVRTICNLSSYEGVRR